MDEFPGLLERDFGFRPQGKSAPMSASKSRSVGGGGFVNLGSGSARSSTLNYEDVFGGPPRYTNPSSDERSTHPSSSSPLGYDSVFQGFRDSATKSSSSLPVHDKPVYDDDIFDGVPGLKSSSSVKYEDVFTSISSATNHSSSPPFDDLLENLGRKEPESKASAPSDKRSGEFDDLIPGFGGSSPPQRRDLPGTNHQRSAAPSAKSTTSMSEDPFVVLETTSTSASSGLFTDPLEHTSRPVNSGSTKIDASSVSGDVFDDINAFDVFTKSVPLSTSEMKNDRKDRSPPTTAQNMSPGHAFARKEPLKESSVKTFENIVPKTRPINNYRESHQTLFEKPSKSSDSLQSFGRSGVPSSDANVNPDDRNATADRSPEYLETADDVWLTVDEIPLFTQPTRAPPPSRPPPPLVIKQASIGKADQGASVGLNAKRKDKGSSLLQSHETYQFSELGNNKVKNPGVSPIDELEEFAMGKPQTYANEPEVFSSEGVIETNSAAAASAAAMKEAMDRAEAKFKHAREVRERDRDAKSAKSRVPAQQESYDKAMPDAQDQEDKLKHEILNGEQAERERKEEEKEQEKHEKERKHELERERERGKARQAVERATREARERAAAEARLKAQRAAVEKANAEARERAERAAVQRVATEARERAAAEAKQRAEKAAAEARERAVATKERAAAEAREKAAAEARERAAVDRAAAEVRLRADRAAVDRATAEARERAAAAAREKQHTNENDLESFFGMGARANSAPKQRAATPETAFDAQFQNKGGSDGARRTSAGSSSTIRKASSTTNIVDDLTSIFGASPSSGEFQEVEGETEERRRARLDRHQRTRERAAKALAEKNERDMQTQREQAERHRIAETLDIEIKRWSAGKEGNLRALLSTMQYVLWPECGWQPVSLTDLITAASVKKVYRKATLCIHPDKVQQKGANLQQKYISEKVFDLLKEAWNKFNSEELF